jgi:predicted flap endonuclease-1-like 5' DNA nuclease
MGGLTEDISGFEVTSPTEINRKVQGPRSQANSPKAGTSLDNSEDRKSKQANRALMKKALHNQPQTTKVGGFGPKKRSTLGGKGMFNFNFKDIKEQKAEDDDESRTSIERMGKQEEDQEKSSLDLEAD